MRLFYIKCSTFKKIAKKSENTTVPRISGLHVQKVGQDFTWQNFTLSKRHLREWRQSVSELVFV